MVYFHDTIETAISIRSDVPGLRESVREIVAAPVHAAMDAEAATMRRRSETGIGASSCAIKDDANQLNCGLNSGQRASSFGFLPSINNTVNYRDRGHHEITHRAGAMRSNVPPKINSTSRSGRSMKPTLQVGISDSARARV